VLSSVLGALLLLSGLAVLALLRFVKLEAQRRVLFVAAVADLLLGAVALALGLSGVTR
jgi:hypothetical protein